MVRHNNVVPNGHFHKDWQRRVKTWFNQPMRKKRRRLARQKKAARLAPRPAKGPLRPIVHCPTVKYNMNINPQFARTIGISVDRRRKNRSVESLQTNVQRLKEYLSRLILFPRRHGKPKSGDSDPSELAMAKQVFGDVLPIQSTTSTSVETRTVTEEERSKSAYQTLRVARKQAKNIGKQKKKEKEQAEETSKE
ncbi:60S ribosomal protein L13 [Galdieria sulphuraria]|nr:60S ribosomal protein L13 [Galdieria sulphuraria]